MKINMIKLPGGNLYPASESEFERVKKLENNKFYIVDIKESQNYKLHQKMFAFFGFCADWYFGDSEAHKDKEKVEWMREKMTIFAGHYTQIFLRDGERFELKAKSINYETMDAEQRREFYSELIDAALKKVFNNCDDQNIINRLVGFF